MDLRGRVALVTGGAGHVGAAMAEALVELGADTVIADREQRACDERVAALAPVGPGHAYPMAGDLAKEDETRELVRRTITQYSKLDILVHCAAFVGTSSFPGWAVHLADQTVSAWDAAFRVNLTAAFVLAQEAAPALRRSGHGSVNLVSSIYGMVGPDMGLYAGTAMQNPTAYGASKGGLLQLTRYLATMLAPDVRVNAISPGGVWRDQPGVFVERYSARTPLGRMATEEDLKGATAFLASDLSAYVTGQNLVVDGGWTAW
jgi:NAD(P)-dependent dehydrogenase (short-subunit alcohol dehydrogenase family)